MAIPYVGEIRLFASNFAPRGWAFCDGSLIPVSGNDELFRLIGTAYGGDGLSVFGLPDMRGRIPVHQGNNFALAQTGGTEEVTLQGSQLPSHTHALMASSDTAAARGIEKAVFGRAPAQSYASLFTPQQLAPQSVSAVGSGRPHTNLQPYLCVNFIISLTGLVPSQD